MKIKRFRADDIDRRAEPVRPAPPHAQYDAEPAEPAGQEAPPPDVPKGDPAASAIGQILLAQGVITPEQLTQALAIQRRTGGQLGRVLVKMGVMSEGQLARALVSQFGTTAGGWSRASGGAGAGGVRPAGPIPAGAAGAGAPYQVGPAPARRDAPPLDTPTRGDPPASGRGDPIGQILLAQGAITQGQLAQALEIQRQSGGQLSRILIKMGVMGEGELARALVRQWGPAAGQREAGQGMPPQGATRQEQLTQPAYPRGVAENGVRPAGPTRAGTAAPVAAQPEAEAAEPIVEDEETLSGTPAQGEPDVLTQDESTGDAVQDLSADSTESQPRSETILNRVQPTAKAPAASVPHNVGAAFARDGSSSGPPGTPARGDPTRMAGSVPDRTGEPGRPAGSAAVGAGSAAAHRDSATPGGHEASPSDSAAKGSSSKVPRVDPIGQILLAQGVVTQEQLRQALEVQRKTGGQLSRILVKMGVVSEAQVARAMARQWGRRSTDRAERPVEPAETSAPAPPAASPALRASAPPRPIGPLPREGTLPDALVRGDSGKAPRIDTIGQILIAQGAITEEQLAQALEIQRQTGGRLGRVLVETGLVSEGALARGLAQQWGRPFTDLGGKKIDPAIARMIPTYLAQRHGVVALERKKNRLVVAMSDPANVVAIDDIRLLTGLDVEIVIASADDIARVQSDLYGVALDVEELLKQSGSNEPEITETDTGRSEEMSLERLQTMVEEAPIVRVVNQIITQAIQAGASDIHLEPHRKEVKVRFRVDGILQDIMSPPKAVQAALTSRVKILASMDIAERRLPQDGHINIRTEGKEYDLRVSTLPTVQGEKVVIRILDQSTTRVSLNKIGLAAALLGQWEELIQKPYGMIIVTGPTGSGKTTTLYTSLGRINKPDINIVSVEDPVEYQMPRVNQVQVNVKAGLTFANGLRSILRQDPDVVLIGEVRDRETAEIAIQASMTGHLVLTTLHTNDAPGAVTRLRDMGIEPFLITSSLLGVMAQRLVRVICPKCKEAYVPPSDALHRLGLDPQEQTDVTLYRGKGCDSCRMTGYRGRVAVCELMTMNDEIRSLVLRGASAGELREAAQRNGMRTLGQDGIQKVLEGITTFEELLRVVFVNEGSEAKQDPA